MPGYQRLVSWVWTDCLVQWCRSRRNHAFFAPEKQARRWWEPTSQERTQLDQQGSSPRSKLRRWRNHWIDPVPSLSILHFCSRMYHNRTCTRPQKCRMICRTAPPLAPLCICFGALRQPLHWHLVVDSAFYVYNIICAREHDSVVHVLAYLVHVGLGCLIDTLGTATHSVILTTHRCVDGANAMSEGVGLWCHFSCSERYPAGHTQSLINTGIVEETIVAEAWIWRGREPAAPGVINGRPWCRAAGPGFALGAQWIVWRR